MPDGVLEYDELQLRIAPSDKERYHVVALGPDRSSADHRFAKPLESVELENFILRIGFPRKKKRGYRSKGMEYAREFGAKLFDALVAEGIREVYVGACKLAAEHDRGLRVTLYLTDVPELMVIPWEFLYDSSQRAFLSQSIYSPVVRCLDLRSVRKPRRVTLPLRVLALASSPAGFEPLDIPKERAKLRKALDPLRRKGMVELEWLRRSTLEELNRRISQPDDVHVLHYIGHGEYDARSRSGVLFLEDKAGNAHEVAGEDLCTVLRDERSLRLVVLNSCEGARTAESDPFAGVATSLVGCQIPAVVAMQVEITDDAAIVFAESLYRSIAQEYTIDAAVAQTRKAIVSAGHETEFGTPVLFLRSGDARLFEIEPAAVTPPAHVEVPGTRARADLSLDLEQVPPRAKSASTATFISL